MINDKKLVILHLVNGEELLAEVVSEDIDGTTNIKNVIQILLQPLKDGGVGPAFLPYANFIDGDLAIEKKNVVWRGVPKKEIAGVHDQAFSKLDLSTRIPKTLLTG